MMHPPILTFWDSSGEKITSKQVTALKTLLKLVGAVNVRKMPNGSVQSKFESWEAMEKANKNILTPLQILFQINTIDSTFGKVNMK